MQERNDKGDRRSEEPNQGFFHLNWRGRRAYIRFLSFLVIILMGSLSLFLMRQTIEETRLMRKKKKAVGMGEGEEGMKRGEVKVTVREAESKIIIPGTSPLFFLRLSW